VNLRFPGQYFDYETGLHFNLDRYYNASLGRYISSDSVGLSAGLNTFGYANGNPLTNYDPMGTNALTAFGGFLQESYNYLNGQGFDGCNVFGALKDGYDGEGDGFGWALGEDVLSFGTVGLGALAKAGLAVKAQLNFSQAALLHMSNPARAVPVQILMIAIKSSKGVPDPRGSQALMHTVDMVRNGNPYKLEVLYDKASNAIWHFKYFD
jgi:RHS repeat-associated protein